jgi:four helix bundle protein
MTKEDLIKQTQLFAVTVIKFIENLPDSRSMRVLSNQLLRCSTSVGANYRSACKGKSTADFINKIVIVEEEADEAQYWLELMELSGLISSNTIAPLKQEAKELTAIFTAIGKTAKENHRNLKISKAV